ncbi:helix-turn-helix transcriptional regulator [Micromonospora sp. NPDC126480]|uniref:helix-turn-helix transcriptional regulator n=1 Tax=Micromonospora sp. NPDC126480 TaxID=3155312 RepID=UPI0033241357
MSAQAPVTHRFDSRDPALIRTHLAASFGTPLRVRVGLDPPRLWQHRIDLGPVRLTQAAHCGDLHIDLAGPDALVICQAVTAPVVRTAAGERHRFAPGDVFVLAPPRHPCTVRWQAGSITTCVLDLDLLARVAGTAPAGPASPLRLAALGPAPPHLVRHWRTTTAYLREAVLGDPEAAGQPLVVGAAVRMVAAAALTVVTDAAVDDTTARDRRDAGVGTVRRALAFMERHAERNIRAADIAAAANVTPRAVQLAFRTHLDTTPMAHLRGIRLHRAHQDLLRADPERETVSRIALRWGFLSHSRFTARYRAAFGVPPSRTLYR